MTTRSTASPKRRLGPPLELPQDVRRDLRAASASRPSTRKRTMSGLAFGERDTAARSRVGCTCSRPSPMKRLTDRMVVSGARGASARAASPTTSRRWRESHRRRQHAAPVSGSGITRGVSSSRYGDQAVRRAEIDADDPIHATKSTQNQRRGAETQMERRAKHRTIRILRCHCHSIPIPLRVDIPASFSAAPRLCVEFLWSDQGYPSSTLSMSRSRARM